MGNLRLSSVFRLARLFARIAWHKRRQPRHRSPYDPDHPLVRCGGCDESFTACDLGNHYCPSCGESADEAGEVPCSHCICIEQAIDSPCCYCGFVLR